MLYLPSGSAFDTARVAKWGVVITTQGDAFAETYDDENDDSGFANTVVADVKVVAPGTEGTLADLSVTGTPEVAVAVTYKAELTLTGWELSGGTEYCPLIFTVEGVTYGMEGSTATNKYATIALLKGAVEGAISGCAKNYPANVAINTSTDAPSISWEWPFESGDDSKDTYLGNQASIGNAPIVTLSITTTATQID